MPAFPKDIQAVRDALLAVTLEIPDGASEAVEEKFDEAATAIDAAQSIASPVVQFVTVFKAMKPIREHLSGGALQLFAGCAYLIHANVWHGLQEEAFAELQAAMEQLAA